MFSILGNLHNEDEVLEWLKKNRFRQPELNVYMYMLIAVAIIFALYTGFLMSCFKTTPTTSIVHVKQA